MAERGTTRRRQRHAAALQDIVHELGLHGALDAYAFPNRQCSESRADSERDWTGCVMYSSERDLTRKERALSSCPDVPDRPVAIVAANAAQRTKPSNYPAPFAAMMNGRIKRPLGDPFGLDGFGVNHVTLPPGTMSALFHRHTVQDEWIYVLSGELTLLHDGGETLLYAGMCAGFPRNGSAHQLVNRSTAPATYLEAGDRRPGDGVSYPRDDLAAVHTAAGWTFAHKDGTPYDGP
jgi:uncharacterized cupin superfamily protein